jgi:hypothetical protein
VLLVLEEGGEAGGQRTALCEVHGADHRTAHFTRCPTRWAALRRARTSRAPVSATDPARASQRPVDAPTRRARERARTRGARAAKPGQAKRLNVPSGIVRPFPTVKRPAPWPRSLRVTASAPVGFSAVGTVPANMAGLRSTGRHGARPPNEATPP